MKAEIDSAISQVIMEGAFIGGKHLKIFEDNLSQYVNANHCVGVGNGTDALEIIIEALSLPHGSEIIVPANSFIASAEAVSRTGHKVVFCDIDPGNYTISVSDVENRITSNTGAIIAVHLYGHPCDMDPLISLANQHNLCVIEDCAQAVGAEYKGQRVGAIGVAGAFSFYPGKNLGAYGDGGAITTNDANLAKKAKMIANHGRIGKYDHQFEGRNSRLDGLQAAILNVKLQHLDEWTTHRISVAQKYLAHLSSFSEITLPIKSEWAKQVYHLFVVRHNHRDRLQQILDDANIQTGIHYPTALPKLSAFAYLGQGREDGFAWKNDSKLLSLPIGEHISEKDIENLITIYQKSFK